MFAAVLPLLLSAQTATTGSLQCETIEDTHKRIQCTFITKRINEDRSVTFNWHSAATPQDDRERTIELKSNHRSVYDYRFYYGRAMGEWEVTVTDSEDNVLATTTFTGRLDGGS